MNYVNTLICEYINTLKREKTLTRYISNGLEISSDDSDESDEE